MTPRSLILGLDASPKRIGWAIIDYDNAHPIKWGTHHLQDAACINPADDLRARRHIFQDIAKHADERGDVCAVIIEDAYVGVSKQGSINHALSVGNVEAFASNRWPFILVERLKPATWRKHIGVKQRGKGPTIDWAKDLTGHTLTDDEADALGIATAGYHLIWQSAG